MSKILTPTPEERKLYREKIEAITEDARSNFQDPAWQTEMANVIQQQIIWGFESNNILDYLTTVDYVGPFDRATVSEVRGMRAFWTSVGGYIEESTINEEVFEIRRDRIGFHVSEYMEKVQANFGVTQAQLIDLGQKRLTSNINIGVLRAFQAAIPSSSPYYTSSAGVSLNTVNELVREVRDETDAPVSIVGRTPAIGHLIDSITNASTYTGFTPNVNEDLMARGVIGKIAGANVVELQHYRDDLNKPFFPANELWVVGQDASKFAFWGGPLTRTWIEQDNWFWHYVYSQDFGGIVWRPQRLRRLVDTTLSGAFASA